MPLKVIDRELMIGEEVFFPTQLSILKSRSSNCDSNHVGLNYKLIGCQKNETRRNACPAQGRQRYCL